MPEATLARVKASPIARRVAAARGVDLLTLRGTGPGGRIMRRDVESPSPAPAPAPQAVTVAVSGRGEATNETLTSVEATIARRMSESRSTVPDFTLTVDVDMDAAVDLRAALKEIDSDAAPSYNDMVVKACGLALRAHPRANGSFREGRFELHDRVNVGVAVAAADALLVPTVFDADVAGLGAIGRETRRLAALARDGALTPSDLGGGTFTVSNLGMFGVTQFTAVINPPQAAILAVGALQQRAVLRDGALIAGQRMSITLTADHRILYGADAAAFLTTVRTALEQPLRLVL